MIGILILGILASLALAFASYSIHLQQAGQIEQAPEVTRPSIDFEQRLTAGLGQARQGIWGRIARLISGTTLKGQLRDEVEEILYSADLSPQMVDDLLVELEKQQLQSVTEVTQWVKDFFQNRVQSIQDSSKKLTANSGETQLVMIVGVNGAGKTTTIGKLATRLKNQGSSVVVGACDTFRAAAVDQLAVWCERAGVEMIRGKESADPSGVAYDTFVKAKNSGADFCLVDTAGRLHTMGNLMEELSKMKRVLSKIKTSGPDHIYLVVDAVTGQNALRQAEEFHKALGLSGIIFTKCDGSAKAGSALTIMEKLKVPVSYIGVGEEVEDLSEFNLEQYLKALLVH